jgi:pimeloyl-ACP methyl ester carboxylesterase
VEGTLQDIIALPSVEPLRQMSIVAIVDAVLATLQRYKPAVFVRDDYIRCYDGNRFAESAELVRAYPQELAVLADRLRTIQTPVQIIQGEHDPFVPVSNGEFLAARLPNARLNALDAGHLAWEDRSDEYSRLVLEWAQMHGHR